MRLGLAMLAGRRAWRRISHLRPLAPRERQILKAEIRDLSLSARVHQRYRIVEQVCNGHSLAETPTCGLPLHRRLRLGSSLQRERIRHLRAGVQPDGSFAHPPGAEQRRELVEVAMSNPQDRGLSVSNWSVPKLGEHSRARRLLPPITDEWIRRPLRREATGLGNVVGSGLRPQKT